MPRKVLNPVRRPRKRTAETETLSVPEKRLMQIEAQETPAPSPLTATSEPNPIRWLWYLLSLMMPFVGVLIGLFLYDHEERPMRLVGRNSLLIGFVVWVLMPMVLFFLIVVLGAVAMMDWIGNVLPPVS